MCIRDRCRYGTRSRLLRRRRPTRRRDRHPGAQRAARRGSQRPPAARASGGPLSVPHGHHDRGQRSTDDTWAIATELATQLPGVHAVRLELPGRGRALKTVWSRSEAEVLAYMDVDLSTDLNALLPLHAALRTGFSDAQCGFKAITRGAADRLLPLVEDTGWFFDTELLVLAERSGLRIHEVPVDWVDDLDSRVHLLATAWGDLRGVLRLRSGLARHEIALPQLTEHRLAGTAGIRP